MQANDFAPPSTIRNIPDLGSLEAMFPPPVSTVLGIAELTRAYRKIDSTRADRHFFDRALEALDVRISVNASELEQIPTSGPVIVVANHPFGGLDGLVAGSLATRRHSNVRVLANRWLGAIPELAPWLLSVDVLGDNRRAHTNAGVLKAALKHLRNRGLLIVFPAGVVSHIQLSGSGISDPPWNRLAAALARRSNAVVVPMFFEGRNSTLFQLAGLVHPIFRTLLLPRELLRRRSSTISVRVGQPLNQTIATLPNDEALTEWFRLRTYDLAPRHPRTQWLPKPRRADIADPIPTHEIERELLHLKGESLLAEQGRFRTYIARADQIPRTLLEIGRLRECTFRAVGEGTGNCLDLDRFDTKYHHLFVYDVAEKLLVGAYRIGFCDELLRLQGVSGLYTSTLFRYETPFVRTLNNTLELGRSFVRAEYQRSPLSLALLWRGIGEVLVRRPEYARLMGPVSISGSYNEAARRLMVSFLENLERDNDSKRSVRARRPPRERLQSQRLVSSSGNVRQLGRLIAELDPKRRGVPVLLEKYLELGGQVLGLNVDSKFGNCVDALVAVDIPNAPKAMLRRFMGPAGIVRYFGTRNAALGLTA